MYPTISEYLEAIKSAEDNFEQLKHLRPVLDDDGQPVMTGGNFAEVFKMEDKRTGKFHAVKCFLREQEGRAEAYRQIAEELEYVSSTFLTPIKYLDKELFVDTSNSDESEFPVLLMDWVEGETLDKYIIHKKYDGYKLSALVQNFYQLSTWLLSQPFAHGDLKPDNIIVTNEGNLVLIDYDGMYVPKMRGQKSRENGTPNYCNPYYDNNSLRSAFSKKIDDFAIVHILLSLNVYSIFPYLISNEMDFSLFRYEDFYNLSNNSLYQKIISENIDVNTSILITLFQKLLYSGGFSIKEWKLLDFTTPRQNYLNLEELMCSLDNIVLAVNLAYSSMLYKDPARNEFELNQYKDLGNRIGLAIEIQENLKKHEWPYDFSGIKYSRLKPNGVDIREGIVQNIASYVLRYLYGIVKYTTITNSLSSNIYGGESDVFTQSYDDKKYESYLDEFVRDQELCTKKYRYLYVFDIKDFFKSVDVDRLKDVFWENTFTKVEWFDDLFGGLLEKSGLQGLNPCSEVDFFFANLYLKSLDEIMMQYDGIKYYRYCDDIRVFSNDDSLQESLTRTIGSVLSQMSLELNSGKTKLIDTKNDMIEMAKACFVISSRLYFGTKQITSLVDGKKLAEIIENDLTTTYLFKLVNTYGTSENHLEDLFYIIRNVHKNAVLYKKISELIFETEIGMGYTYDSMLFSYILKNIVDILNDEKVEGFVKYWVLRTFFCTDEHYYKKYIVEENRWKEQSWYPKPCYMAQISNILEKKFRKASSNTLLYHISDYIISIVEPFDPDDKAIVVDNLPF